MAKPAVLGNAARQQSRRPTAAARQAPPATPRPWIFQLSGQTAAHPVAQALAGDSLVAKDLEASAGLMSATRGSTDAARSLAAAG
mmetsp:Transcript_97440/g.193032  ORF Transcript_97440/g.193032 Transcript_97440/m.193032 type:complete len:85 (-) Transcript_97440:859-1113(-)